MFGEMTCDDVEAVCAPGAVIVMCSSVADWGIPRK